VSSTAAPGPSGRPGTFQRDNKYSGFESGFLKLYDAESGRGSHGQKVAAVNKIWSTPANKVSVTPSTCAGWKIRRALCYYEQWYLDALIKGEPYPKRVKPVDVLNKLLAARFPDEAEYVEVREVSMVVDGVPTWQFGLFAKKEIPYGWHITTYRGRVLAKDEPSTSTFVYGGKGGRVDAGDDMFASYARYINTSFLFTFYKPSNVCVIQSPLHVVAGEVIPVGDELINNYGKQYAKNAIDQLELYCRTNYTPRGTNIAAMRVEWGLMVEARVPDDFIWLDEDTHINGPNPDCAQKEDSDDDNDDDDVDSNYTDDDSHANNFKKRHEEKKIAFTI
jgi:hypothetical protein